MGSNIAKFVATQEAVQRTGPVAQFTDLSAELKIKIAEHLSPADRRSMSLTDRATFAALADLRHAGQVASGIFHSSGTQLPQRLDAIDDVLQPYQHEVWEAAVSTVIKRLHPFGHAQYQVCLDAMAARIERDAPVGENARKWAGHLAALATCQPRWEGLMRLLEIASRLPADATRALCPVLADAIQGGGRDERRERFAEHCRLVARMPAEHHQELARSLGRCALDRLPQESRLAAFDEILTAVQLLRPAQLQRKFLERLENQASLLPPEHMASATQRVQDAIAAINQRPA